MSLLSPASGEMLEKADKCVCYQVCKEKFQRVPKSLLTRDRLTIAPSHIHHDTFHLQAKEAKQCKHQTRDAKSQHCQQEEKGEEEEDEQDEAKSYLQQVAGGRWPYCDHQSGSCQCGQSPPPDHTPNSRPQTGQVKKDASRG